MMRVLVVNGPNLGMLGRRPKEHYGTKTLSEINELMLKEAEGSLSLDFFLSNSEGEIVSRLNEAIDNYEAIIINPAAYTHTSIAIRDALEIFNGVKLEVHLSDINNRDEFRRINYIRDVCDKSFIGKGYLSYIDAIKYLKEHK